MSKHRQKSQITHLVIHCAATQNGQSVAPATIDQWHRQRGFKRAYAARLGEQEWAGKGLHAAGLAAIGYHFVIDVSGVVQCGRHLTETGAHTVDPGYPSGHPMRRYYNDRAIATCLIGTDRFTDQQWAALKEHVKGLQQAFPGIKVIGHHDVDSRKACPCFDVSAWMAEEMIAPADHLLEPAP